MARVMHRLILMRHAQAQPSAPAGGDEARALSETGLRDAALMGRALAERGLRPDLALVSRRLGEPTGSDHRPVVTQFTRAAP